MAKEVQAPEVKEGVLTHREESPTAENAHKRLHGVSGTIPYAVTVIGSLGPEIVEVEAATGDEAAAAINRKYPAAKIAHIAPAER